MVVRGTSRTPPQTRLSFNHEVDWRGDGRGPTRLRLPYPKSDQVTIGRESKQYWKVAYQQNLFLQSRNSASTTSKSSRRKTYYSSLCEQLPPRCSVQRPIPHFRKPRAYYKYEISQRQRRAQAYSKTRQKVQSGCYV